MQRTLIPQWQSEDDRFVISSSLMILIFWEAATNTAQLADRLEKAAAEYGMEISADKSKILVNSVKAMPSTDIRMNGKVLEEADQFK